MFEWIQKKLEEPVCEEFPKGRRYVRRNFVKFSISLKSPVEFTFVIADEVAIMEQPSALHYCERVIVYAPYRVRHIDGENYAATRL